jgi:ribA/ribD-fused uncharacterized protein
MNNSAGKEGLINSFRYDFFFLSNFYNAPIEHEGIVYQNNEAAFQAQKCVDIKDRERFANISPSDAKRLGRRVELRKDWEQVKVSIMTEIVREKFQQNPDLADKLLATGNAHLEEGNTWGDRIWGTVNGQGANMLGKILMQVREELSQECKKTVAIARKPK